VPPRPDGHHGRRGQRHRQDDDDRQARLPPAEGARPHRRPRRRDTFRAAAVEQLAGWAARAGCEIVRGPEGSDPGSVAFEAVKRGRELGADVVIIDTAGRLHNQDHLMEELAKIRRVIGKQLADAPTRRC
jgi:hypothetical protein